MSADLVRCPTHPLLTICVLVALLGILLLAEGSLVITREFFGSGGHGGVEFDFVIELVYIFL